jgi:hypothetical protein
MRGLVLATILSLAGFSAAGSPLPVVLFNDTFDVSANNFDINFENAVRQSGLSAPLAWTEDPLSSGAADFMTQVGNTLPAGLLAPTEGVLPYTWISPSLPFAVAPRLRIEFEAWPVYFGDGSSPDWVSLSFGNTAAGAFPINPEMGFIIRDGGNVEVFDGGVGVASVAAGFQQSYDVTLDLFDLDFGSPGPVLMNLKVGNTMVLTNYVRAAGFTNNWLTVGAFNSGPGAQVNFVDNFVVSIPEASTVTMCGLASLGLLVVGKLRRKSS